MGQGTTKLIYVQTSASPLLPSHYYICQGSSREQKRGMGCDKHVVFRNILFPALGKHPKYRESFLL